jgi:hypothetical protein
VDQWGKEGEKYKEEKLQLKANYIKPCKLFSVTMNLETVNFFCSGKGSLEKHEHMSMLHV